MEWEYYLPSAEYCLNNNRRNSILVNIHTYNNIVTQMILPYMQNNRANIVSSINLDLTRLKNWGSYNFATNSFIHMTSRDWNSLSLSVFSATYLQSFKTGITDTFDSDPYPEISSSFHHTWVHRRLQRSYLFGATSSCTNIIIKINK